MEYLFAKVTLPFGKYVLGDTLEDDKPIIR